MVLKLTQLMTIIETNDMKSMCCIFVCIMFYATSNIFISLGSEQSKKETFSNLLNILSIFLEYESVSYPELLTIQHTTPW